MGKKNKLVFFKQNLYGIKYESLFSNGKYSDIQIIIGNDKFYLHKNILSSSSKFFEENIKNVNEFEIKDDSKYIKRYLEFLYNGYLAYTKEDDENNFFFEFLILAIKVKLMNNHSIKLIIYQT
jgi:hypothetical protein